MEGPVPTQIVFLISLCFPCVFPVQPQIFPVPIYIICYYYIHKIDLADQSRFWKKKRKISLQISQYPFTLESGNLQLEQTKFPGFSQGFGKISKFPGFSLTVIFWGPFSLFALCCGYPELPYLPPLTTGYLVLGSASVEWAPFSLRTFRENSMTAHCRPRHTPRHKGEETD